MAELIVTLSNGRTQRHPLGPLPLIIGRERSCDVFINDPSTSRRHARLVPTPQGYRIEDLGSKNGTLVNGQACPAACLKDGDQILLGSVVVTFHGAAPSSGSVVIEDDAAGTREARYVSRRREPVLPQRRLQMIYELSERLTTLRERARLLEDALSICCEVLGFERGAIGIRRPGERRLDWPVVRHLHGAEGELKISRSILNRALEDGERVLFIEGAHSDPTVSIVQQGIRSAMCVPLLHEDQVLGVIYGDRLSSVEAYEPEDMDFLAGIARQITIGLLNTYLWEEQQQMVRLQQELQLARRIQCGLFPRQLPAHGGVQVEALNEPGNRVSGDYYDVIEAPEGRLWLLMADVSGEGVAAALLMANLQATVRLLTARCADPAELLAACNRHVFANTEPAKFATCLAVLLDPVGRCIRFASAGHYAPVLLTGAGQPPRELTGESSLPLGVVEAESFTTTVAEAPTGPFTILCYTDGVIEARNLQDEPFGKERLLDALSQLDDSRPREAVRVVREAVGRFTAGAPHSDDLTVLAVGVT